MWSGKEWVPKKDVISTKSKLNAVEGIDKVKSLKLAVELGVGESRLGMKKEGKGKVEDYALSSLQKFPPL